MMRILIPRRMRMRVTRDTKTKIAWTFFISVFLVIFINSFGFVKVYFEKDFETEFSYPLDVLDFQNLVHRFKNGESVEHQPINNNYSNINFITTAPALCSKSPVGLLILVKSAPQYFEKRAAIRATWGHRQYLSNLSNSLLASSPLLHGYCSPSNLSCTSLKQFRIKLVFLLGNDLSMKSHHKSTSTASQFSPKKTHSSSTHSPSSSNDNYILSSDHQRKQNLVKNEITHKHTTQDHQNYPRALSTSHQSHFTKDKTTSQNILEKEPRLERRLRFTDSNNNDNRESTDSLLEQEILKYGDIVHADFVDSYDNNTYKTMIGLRWAVEYCKDFQYSLLADDDMYVSVKNLIKFMEAPNTYPHPVDLINNLESQKSEHLYAGKVLSSIKPVRRNVAKWYLSLDEYQFNYFPPYMPAAAIVMSRSTVQDFYYASYFTQHFRFDDIFLAILAHKMNITPVNSNYFYVCHTSDGSCDSLRDHDTSKYSDPMDFVIARHGLSTTKELIDLWKQQKSLNKL